MRTVLQSCAITIPDEDVPIDIEAQASERSDSNAPEVALEPQQ